MAGQPQSIKATGSRTKPKPRLPIFTPDATPEPLLSNGSTPSAPKTPFPEYNNKLRYPPLPSLPIEQHSTNQWRNQILARLSECRHIVPFVGLSLNPENPFLVFEWMKNGSLSQMRKSLGGKYWRRLRREKPLLLVRIAHNVASACVYLDKMGILHRSKSSFHTPPQTILFKCCLP